jgi:competence protein ComEA
MKMKQFLRDYFTFNKKERNGVFVLIAIIILLIIYLNVSQNFYKNDPVDFSKFEKEIAAFENPSNTHYPKSFEKKEEQTPHQQTMTCFNFNPNNLSEESWLKLGLSQKQIKTIKNYEAKGGRFRKKEDLKKIYGIRPELYAKLENYITFSTIADSSKLVNEKQLAVDNRQLANEKEKLAVGNNLVGNKNQLIELNSADSAQLTTINGIGPFYAKTIIKYRNSVGGFHSKEQLMEVWKFDQEKYNAVEKSIVVDATKIRKININTCEAKHLQGQYLKWQAANAIVNYRAKHGNYKTVDEIKKTDLVDEETFRKIEPYLIVE